MKARKFIAVILSCVLGLFLLCACSNSETPSAPAAIYAPGIYTGTGAGKGGDVNVEMEFSEDEILSIVVDENNNETPEIAAVAYEELPEIILEAQSVDVDTVSGATFTSKGILEAASNCVEQAKL